MLNAEEGRQKGIDENCNGQLKWVYRINLAILKLYASVCSIGLIYSSDNQLELRWYQKRTWLSRLVRLMYMLCLAHLLLSLYHQYRYDFKLAQLKHRLQQQPPHCQTFNLNSNDNARDFSCWLRAASAGPAANHTLDALRRAVDAERTQLRAVGAPHMDANFVIEYVYGCLIIMSIGFYVSPQLYCSFVRPADFYLVRYLLNNNVELDNCRAMIAKEIELFIRSSKAFVRNSLDWAHLDRYQAHESSICALHAGLVDHKFAGMRLFHYRQTRRLLRSMQKKTTLWPINRTAKWIEGTLKFYSLLSISGSLYCLFFGVLLAGYLIKLNSATKSDHFHYLDIQMLLNFAYMSLVNMVSAMFICMLLICGCLDQIRLVCRLRSMVVRFRVASETQLEALRRHVIDGNQPHEPRLVVSQLNHDLLYIILQFKIFLAQLAPIKQTFALYPSLYIAMSIAMAVIGRVHLAYVDVKEFPYFGYSVFMFSSFGLIFLDLCITPLSYLNSRSLDLFRSLQSLLAHLVTSNLDSGVRFVTSDEPRVTAEKPANEPKRRDQIPQASIIYSEHTISILRRELDHPHQLMGQFAFVSIGFACNYSNFMRIHFWLGMIMISLVVDSQSYGIFSKLVHDPLNVYEH